jgi:ferredoxin
MRKEGSLMPSKITVLQERCIAAGNCYEIAAKYFDQDPVDGTVVLIKGDVDGSDETTVDRAAATCPVAAIEKTAQGG